MNSCEETTPDWRRFASTTADLVKPPGEQRDEVPRVKRGKGETVASPDARARRAAAHGLMKAETDASQLRKGLKQVGGSDCAARSGCGFVVLSDICVQMRPDVGDPPPPHKRR